MHPPLRAREDEHPEARLAEVPFEVSGERQLQIVLGLFLPDRPPFVSQIDFKECRERFLWGPKFHKSVRD